MLLLLPYFLISVKHLFDNREEVCQVISGIMGQIFANTDIAVHYISAKHEENAVILTQISIF